MDLVKILLVELQEQALFELKDALLGYGYVCFSATTLDEITLLCDQHNFEYLILETNFQSNNAVETLLLNKEFSPLHKTKLLLYVASSKNLKRETLFQYTIVDYFLKEEPIKRNAIQIDKLIKRLYQNKSVSILLIDDSSIIENSLTQLLVQRNYNLLSTTSCKNGLQFLDSRSFELVILNLATLKLDAIPLLEHLREKFEEDMIPVLILSEHEDSYVLSRFYKLGASHIQKNPDFYEALLMNIDYWVDYHRKNRELIYQQRLLKEYKETVDVSNIVSKTDSKGVITYVNQQFCDISGYTVEELLGKPHNIIRHKDMASDAFKEMWHTIKNKQIWRGLVKNRAKNGRPYYVETTIKPIVDGNGNIVEFIGIRKDVTEHEELKEQLEDKLQLTKTSLQEMFHISNEYHKAMDVSTILTRADLNGNITYINELFTQALGYTYAESIGQNHRFIKHPDTPDNLIKNLWNTILQGKIWKGMMINKSKSGATVWLDTVIVPISNSKGELLEYLTIRKDVSDVVNMHKEIETTQGELIYTLSAAAETRSKETGNHIRRVAHYCKILAQLWGLDTQESEILFQASPMHDIGKLAIPDHILNKPGKFTEDEWEIMKTHSELGYKILNNSTRSILKASAIVAYEHHEKWDGSGYPRGLKDTDIHIYGRITAIADVFDALGSERVYKKAWELEDILKLFEEQKGRHFDPNLVDLFLNNLDKFLEIRDTFVDIVYNENK